MTEPSKSHPELGALLIKARETVDAMSPDEIEAMLKIQRESVARAEASWPKAKFTMIDGVKTYASYEDYCND